MSSELKRIKPSFRKYTKRKNLEIQLNKVASNKPIEIGDIRGFLVVVDSSEERDYTKLKLWKCRCVCGEYCLKNKVQLSTTKFLPSCGCKGLKKLVNIHQVRAKILYNSKFEPFSKVPKKARQKLLLDFISKPEDYEQIISNFASTYKVQTAEVSGYLTDQANRLHSSLTLLKLKNIQEFTLETTPAIQTGLANFINSNDIQAAIVDKLSDPNSETLTPYEEVYATVLGKTNNPKLALDESNFSELLPAADKMRKMLLSEYLQQKPNICARVNEIRSKRRMSINVSKDNIQEELCIQIQQLKDTVSMLPIDSNSALGTRGHLLKSIELLGKTIGSFQDSVKVDHVNSGDVLDKLIEMTKESEQIAVSTYRVVEEDSSDE